MFMVIVFVVVGVLYVVDQEVFGWWIVIVYVVGVVVWMLIGMVWDVLCGYVGFDIFVVVVMVVMFVVGEYIVVLIIVFMLLGGEVLEDFVGCRVKCDFFVLFDCLFCIVYVLMQFEVVDLDEVYDVLVDDVVVGDVLLVCLLEIVFVDGIFLIESGMFDEFLLIGESMLVMCEVGGEVLLGVINGSCVICIRVLWMGVDSQYQQIVVFVYFVEFLYVLIVWFVDWFVILFIVVFFVFVGIVWVIFGDVICFVEVLVFVMFCLLLIVVFVVFFGGFFCVVKFGVIMKSGVVIEQIVCV